MSERYFHMDFDPVNRTSGSVVFSWMNPERSTICDTGDPMAQPHLNLRQVLETWRSSRVQVWSGIKLVLLRLVSGSSWFLMVSSAFDVDTQVKSVTLKETRFSWRHLQLNWNTECWTMSHGSVRTRRLRTKLSEVSQVPESSSASATLSFSGCSLFQTSGPCKDLQR